MSRRSAAPDSDVQGKRPARLSKTRTAKAWRSSCQSSGCPSRRRPDK